MLSTTKPGFKSDHWPIVEFSASFRLSVRRNLGLHLFRFLLLCDWSKRMTTSSQPIRFKTATNHDLRFPALQAVGSFLLWVLIGSLRSLAFFWFASDHMESGLTTLNWTALYFMRKTWSKIPPLSIILKCIFQLIWLIFMLNRFSTRRFKIITKFWDWNEVRIWHAACILLGSAKVDSVMFLKNHRLS